MDCPSCHLSCEPGARSCPGCGAALPLGPGSLVGGRFELLARLGAGGMGTVFRARDHQLGVDVALKVLRLGQDKVAVRRFHSEVRLARAVKHRHVCSVYEYGEDGDVVFYVMELVRGRTLGQMLRESPLAWEEASRIALEAAEGLQAIHEAGVIHRDIKSSNLMIDERGNVRLVDFGIAKTQPGDLEDTGSSHTSLTGALAVVGSPEYMSPEQVRGAPLDVRSDIYAFGLVLYELFTGRLPFAGTTSRDIMLKRLEEPASFDGPVAARLPPALVPVLKRALAKDPEDRYESMATLVVELASVRRSLVTSETEAIRPAGVSAGIRHRRLWPKDRAKQVAVAALLVAGVVVAYSLAKRDAVPPASSVRMTAMTTPEPSEPTVRPTAAAPSSPAPSPEPRGTPARARPRPTPASDDATHAPRTSPDAVARGSPASPAVGEPAAVAADSQPAQPTATLSLPEARVPLAPAVTTPPAPAPSETPPTTPPAGEPEVPARCTGAEIRYCPQAESLRIEGQIVIEVRVHEDGSVSDPVLVRSDDGVLSNCALRSVDRLRCEPATRGGEPVESRRRILFDFRLPR